MKDQVAWITGATSGIGAATARLLAARGAIVVLGGRREAEGEAVAAGIREAGGRASFGAVDVTDEASVEAAIRRLLNDHGRLDMAVNNAGYATGLQPFTETPAAVLEGLLRTNVVGVFHCMKAELRAMAAAGRGAIVNTSSIVGLKGFAQAAPYTASKFAVEGLTRAAALEYAGRGVRVNAVAPGPTVTALLPDDPAIRGALEGAIPLGRVAEADEVARGIVWLLSDEASFAVGTTLSLDGGLAVR